MWDLISDWAAWLLPSLPPEVTVWADIVSVLKGTGSIDSNILRSQVQLAVLSSFSIEFLITIKDMIWYSYCLLEVEFPPLLYRLECYITVDYCKQIGLKKTRKLDVLCCMEHVCLLSLKY